MHKQISINKVFHLLLFMLLAACGSTKNRMSGSANGNGIINGKEVPDDSPLSSSLVKISDPSLVGEQRICTGALVAENVVLLAAHCLYLSPEAISKDEDFEMRDIDKLIVSSYIDGSEYQSSVEDVRAFSLPGRGFNGDDLALIKLSELAPRGMNPIKLVGSVDGIHNGDHAMIAGFGKFDAHLPDDSLVLRQGTMQFSNIHFTDKLIELTEMESEKQTTCSGDSGSPGLIEVDGELRIWGVLRGGSAFCGPKSYFTNALLYKNWITDTIQKWKSI